MITTRTEDKNKNNFKMIMENFRNWNEKDGYTLASETISKQSKVFLSNKLGFGNNISLFESWSGGHINDYGRLILEIEALNFLRGDHKDNDCKYTKTILDLHELRVHLLLQNVSPKIKNLSEGLNLKEPLLVENLASTGGKLLAKVFGDDVALAAIKSAPALAVQSITKATDEPFLKYLAKGGGAAPKGFAQWAAKHKGLVKSLKAAAAEGAERGFGKAATKAATTTAGKISDKAAKELADAGVRGAQKAFAAVGDDLMGYVAKNGVDDKIITLLKSAERLVKTGAASGKGAGNAANVLVNKADRLLTKLGKTYTVKVPTTKGGLNVTKDVVLGKSGGQALQNLKLLKGMRTSVKDIAKTVAKKPAPKSLKPKPPSMTPMTVAKVPTSIQDQVAKSLADMTYRKVIAGMIKGKLAGASTMTKAMLSRMAPTWIKKLDKTGKAGLALSAAMKLGVGVAIYMALREKDPSLPPLDQDIDPEGHDLGPVNPSITGGILAQIAQAGGYNADVSGMGDGMLNDTSFQVFLANNNVDIDSIQDGTELIPYINDYLISMGAPPLNFDAATADANAMATVNNFLQQLQSGGAQPAPGPSPTPGPSPAPAPAGAPNWLKRKADKQAELIRRLNQGVTGLQEEARPDPTKMNAKISAGGLKLDTDNLKLSDAAPAAGPVPGTEKQSVTLKMLQQSLIDMGYNLGPRGADGEYGRATYKAIRKFQADNKLQKDGLIGPNTFSHMRRKDKKLMSQSATMGADLPKEIEKTVDKIAKAPRDKKKEAYAKGVISKPEDIKKLKDKARSIRKDAIKKLKQAKIDKDLGEMNRQQRRIEKATGVFRSVTAGEKKARELKSQKQQVEFARKAGMIFMAPGELELNLKTWADLKPYELKEWFMDSFCKGKSSKFEVLRMIHVLRTGFYNSPDGEYKKLKYLQQSMTQGIEIWKTQYEKTLKKKK